MDGLPFCLAFVMVKESVVVPAIFFYLDSAAKKDRGGQAKLISSISVIVVFPSTTIA